MNKKNNWDITQLDTIDLDDLLLNFPKTLSSHGKRVAMASSIMAEYAVSNHYVEGMPQLPAIAYLCGTLHDIGMLLIPFLSADEVTYEQHPLLGAKFLSKYGDSLFNDEEERSMVIEAVHCHHEQPNGEGFPHGLKSKNIPLLAGICAIADSLDHIIINRNEEPSDMQDAAQYIMSKSGIVFGETAALIFEQCLGSLSALYAKQDDAQ